MKVFRHNNGFLYTIEQKGLGKTITPPDNWDKFEAVPYRSNRNAPQLPLIEPDREDRTGAVKKVFLDFPENHGFTQVFEQ
jgi:hypothetical protein